MLGRLLDAIDQQVGDIRLRVSGDDGGDFELDHGSSFGTGSERVNLPLESMTPAAPRTAGCGGRATLDCKAPRAPARRAGGISVLTVGIDIGGTKIAGGVVDERGRRRRDGAGGHPGRRPRTRRCRRRHDRAPARGARRRARRRRRRRVHRPRPLARLSTHPTSTGATSRCASASRRASASTSRSRTTPTRPAGPSTASAPAAACTTWSCSRWAPASAARSSPTARSTAAATARRRSSATCASSAAVSRAAAGRADASRCTRPVARCSGRRTRWRMPAASAPRSPRPRAEHGHDLGRRDLAARAGRRPRRAGGAAPRRHGARRGVRRLPGRPSTPSSS